MRVLEYTDKVISAELCDIKNAKLYDIMKVMHKYNKNRFYITQNKTPIYYINACRVFEKILQNAMNKTIEEIIKENPIEITKIKYSTDLLNAYNFMRKNKVQNAAIINDKDELIGEIEFKTISLKLADIAIKDEITGDFNESYFRLFLDNYKKYSDEELGFVCISITNAVFIEDLYGIDTLNSLLKFISSTIKNKIRNIDFVFRVENKFIIATFSPLYVTEKIFKRVKETFEKTDIDYANFEFHLSHFPTLALTIPEALQKCEDED